MGSVSHVSLLWGKLHRPTSTATTIPRIRLLGRLQTGLRCKVTLISAAAGAGKSTLLSAWLDQLDAPSHPPETRLPHKASWLTLDQADNQLPRFLRYLLAAIEQTFPHSCVAVTSLLQENADPTVEAVADALTNGLALLPARLVLVLDDLHQIDNVAIYALLARLIQYAPTNLHMVLSTRMDPPLPLNRWRAQGWLNELRRQELSFTVAEATVFLEKTLQYNYTQLAHQSESRALVYGRQTEIARFSREKNRNFSRILI